MRYYWIVLVLGCICTPSFAATWTVEKDGSGDFTIIQDAIDAAADGDTVRVGPGRYDDFRPYETLFNGTAVQIIMMVRSEIVLQGTGEGAVIIGPESFAAEIDGSPAGGFFVDVGGSAVISNFSFEHLRQAGALVSAGIIERCRIDGSGRDAGSGGLLSIATADDVTIMESLLVGPGVLLSIGSDGVERLLVADTVFDGLGSSGVGLALRGNTEGSRILRCEFRALDSAVQFLSGATASIDSCIIAARPTGVGLIVESGVAVVRNTTIRSTEQPVSATGGLLEMTNCVVEGAVSQPGSVETTIFIAKAGTIRNSHILNGGGLSLDGPNFPNRPVDVRNNWWGTTDLALIESWIKDDNGEVLYLPILEAPVSAPVESMGSIKSRYRGAEN